MREMTTSLVARGTRCLSRKVVLHQNSTFHGAVPVRKMSSSCNLSSPRLACHEYREQGRWAAGRPKRIDLGRSRSIDIAREYFANRTTRAFSSSVSRHWRTAYIAVGSNLGNRVRWIEKALKEMRNQGIRVKRTSSLWETEPMYVIEQDRFLNGVVEIETNLAPEPLLRILQGIENFLGRQKFQDKGPRNIDLDILLYEGEVVKTEDLNIPHALMLEREFVLRPLAELIPDGKPSPSQLERTTREFLDALPPSPSPMYSLTYLDPEARFSPLSPLNPTRSTHIMGVVNLTPDSFSDGGKYSPSHRDAPTGANTSSSTDQETTRHNSSIHDLIHSFSDSGMSPIIDIGGQSTAPHTPEVSAEEEASRVCGCIKEIAEDYPNHLISIDTYRASVAESAAEAGAHIINDVSAGQMDPEMLGTVAKSGRTIILMHMRGTPATMTRLTDYEPAGLIPTIASELLDRVREAQEAGIPRWRIILDPGIGFAKTATQNLEILRRMRELREWPGLEGFPWLVGSSRKGFIGRVTGVKKPEDRLMGSMVAVTAAIQGGADIVRVHDVKEAGEVIKMADAIWRVKSAELKK